MAETVKTKPKAKPSKKMDGDLNKDGFIKGQIMTPNDLAKLRTKK